MPSDVDDGSFFTCGGPQITEFRFVQGDTTFTCDDIGDNPVLFQAVAGIFSANSCDAVVTVVDHIPPTAICQDFSVTVDANGEATVAAENIDDGSFDNCGIADFSISRDEFTCNDLGENTVTLTVTDGSGNESTCCLLYTSPSPRDATLSRMPSSA